MAARQGTYRNVCLFVRFRPHSGHVPNGEPTDFTVQGKAAEGVLMCALHDQLRAVKAALRAD